MLHVANDAIHPRKNSEPLWTQDESIEFECAKEVISDLMGICSGKIAEEEAKPNPDLEKIKNLKAELSARFDERVHLYLKSNSEIKRLNIEYGKIVREHRRKDQVNFTQK